MEVIFFMPVLYIDQQEKQIDQIVKYLSCKYDVTDLKFGDYTNDEMTFVVERKNWQDYIGSVIDGSLMEQCDKIRKNYDGLAGVIFEGDFWAMLGTVKNKGLKHKLVFTRYRITSNYNMFFEECIDKYATCKTLEFLNENAAKIDKPATGFKTKHIKTGDRRVLALTSVPKIGKKMAEQILSVYGSIYTFLEEIIKDEKSVMESLDRFGPKILDNVINMFLSDTVYTKKQLTKDELNKLRKLHAKKRQLYEKLKEKS